MKTKTKAAKNLTWDEYRKLCPSYSRPTQFFYTGCQCRYSKEKTILTFCGRKFTYLDCGEWCPRLKWWKKQHKDD